MTIERSHGKARLIAPRLSALESVSAAPLRRRDRDKAGRCVPGNHAQRVVFDPSPRDYPADTDGQRALYMVLTRAKERLRFVAQQKVTSLLEQAVAQGFIDVSKKPTVPPVELTAEDGDPF